MANKLRITSCETWKATALDEWQAFLRVWPIERLETMSLNDYMIGGGDQQNFSWAIEFGTSNVVGIRDATRSMFLIYRNKEGNICTISELSGMTPEDAFAERVRPEIVAVAKAAREGDLDKLAELERSKLYGSMVFWKIAYLYQPLDRPYLLPIASLETMKTVADLDRPPELNAPLQKHYADIFRQDPAHYWETAYDCCHPEMTMPLEESIDTAIRLLENRKNLILEGAPGTGKTYAAAEIVTRMAGLVPRNQAVDRPTVKRAYDRLVEEGRVVFTTFHPGTDYEDFIEGYRPAPLTDGDKNPGFVLKDGIFKQIADAARTVPNLTVAESAKIWKLSIGKKNQHTERALLLKDCFENGRIRSKGELSRLSIGDVVLVLKHANKEKDEQAISAVGTITGNVGTNANDDFAQYSNVCPVKWVWHNESQPLNIIDSLTTGLEGPGLFELKPGDRKGLIDSINTHISKTPVVTEKPPYFLVIDEINRGNISKIFGELITLIERDKREGAENAVSLRLTYSNESFSVPENLYMIGTMNTADRSIGTIDYALRRRFAFHRLLPREIALPNFDKALFNEVKHLFMNDKGVPNRDMLSEEFAPDDVCLGHSYFIMQDDNLGGRDMRIQYEIVPLLKEYVQDGVLKPAALASINALLPKPTEGH